MKRSIGVLMAATIVAGLMSGSPVAAQATGPIDCPEIMPTDQITDGMTGVGWTVAEGRTPEQFQVEVLGVMRDAYPGRDLIVVRTSGDVIDRHGGVWYGTSGSPVYVDDKLIGAISFGLTYGASKVVGLTPAEEMAAVMNQPEAEAMRIPNSIEIPRSFQREMGAGSEVSFERLKTPVTISGLGARGLARTQRIAERESLPILPVSGSVAGTASTEATGTLHAADNMAAAFSYGDVTYAGVGTTTMVCDGRAMSFGHPFMWEGDTTIGANAADAITVVEDPFYPYKLATIEEGVGTVDQDRFAGLRTLLGSMPASIPITSTVTALTTGRTREGRTDVLENEIVPWIAWSHVYGNVLFTVDEYGPGNASASWTITGTTSTGTPWELSRSNLYSSEWSIAENTGEELSRMLWTLYSNDFDEVTFTSVDYDASVGDEEEYYKITDLLVQTKDGEYESRRRLRVRPGQTLNLRAVLQPYEETGEEVVDLTLVMPNRLRDSAIIEVGSGPRFGGDVCLYRPRRCEIAGQKIETFDQLVQFLEELPTNNELLARMRSGRRARIMSEDSELLDRVVFGQKTLRVSF